MIFFQNIIYTIIYVYINICMYIHIWIIYAHTNNIKDVIFHILFAICKNFECLLSFHNYTNMYKLDKKIYKSESIDRIVFPSGLSTHSVVKLTPPIQRTRQLNYALITQRVHSCVAHRSPQCRLIVRTLRR